MKPMKWRMVGHSEGGDFYEHYNEEVIERWVYSGNEMSDWKNPKKWRKLI